MAEFVFDMHTIFGPVPPRGGETSTARLEALLTRDGVAGAVALSTRGIYHSAAAGNRETIQLCKQATVPLLPAAVLDPRQPEVMQTLNGARMLCLMPFAQRWPIIYAPLYDMLRALLRAGEPVNRLPLWCQCSRAGDATAISTVLKEVNFTGPVVLGSIGHDSLIEAISLARSNQQFSIATNGLRGVGEIALVVAAIGAHRVVFCSSAPARSLGSALAITRYAGLSDDDCALVLGGNARRLLFGGDKV